MFTNPFTPAPFTLASSANALGFSLPRIVWRVFVALLAVRAKSRRVTGETNCFFVLKLQSNYSVVKRSIGNATTRVTNPLRKMFSFAKSCKENASTLIAGLFYWGRPLAICGRVRAIVVFAFKPQSLGVLISQSPRLELRKTQSPFATNLYSARAVSREDVKTIIVATANHPSPNSEQWIVALLDSILNLCGGYKQRRASFRAVPPLLQLPAPLPIRDWLAAVVACDYICWFAMISSLCSLTRATLRAVSAGIPIGIRHIRDRRAAFFAGFAFHLSFSSRDLQSFLGGNRFWRKRDSARENLSPQQLYIGVAA